MLSPGTKDYDQGRKFEFYRSVTSLKDYILIDQERCLVMVYQKTNTNEWKLRFLDNIIAVFSRMRGNKILKRLTVKDSNTPHSCDYRYNANFMLDSVGIELNLTDIYEDIYS